MHLLFKKPKVIGSASILLIVFLCAFLTPLINYDPDIIDLSQSLCTPNPRHFLGCDLYGRDLLLLLIQGAKTSLLISFSTVFFCTLVGTFFGLVSGFFLGIFDFVVMRICDILMAFPGILLTMALTALLGPNMLNVILAISATGWVAVARLVRAETLKIKGREFVAANQALGAFHFQTITKHILPSCLTPLMIHSTFSISSVIIVEASLSFLGLSGNDSHVSWGSLLHQGQTVLSSAPHLSLVPGLMIVLVVLSVNILGDSFRDFLDPHSRNAN